MNKIKIFLGSACLVLAVAAVAAAKIAPAQQFDYYITNAGVCAAVPETNCVAGDPTCIRFINAAQGNKQLYESRVLIGGVLTCQTELQELP